MTRRALLVSGSLRSGSTDTALLRTAARASPTGTDPVPFEGLDRLPHFDPDRDREPLHPEVEAARAAIRSCVAVLFSTPEHVGPLPGAFENVMEWAVGDDSAKAICEKPVGWINVSASPTGAAGTYRSLAIVLGYVHATVVEAACAKIPVSRQMVGSGGLIADLEIRERVAAVLEALVS